MKTGNYSYHVIDVTALTSNNLTNDIVEETVVER